MIVLNYHQISDTIEDSEFYTVSTAEFSRHLKVLVERNIKVAASDEVLEGRADSKSVMLHFDDGTADHFDKVAPLLGQYGFFGVFFISTSKIGSNGYLSEADVRKMAIEGHSIECHGHSHRRMDRMPAEDLAAELQQSVEIIQRLTGRHPRIIAPPGGFLSTHVITTAADMGMHVIRTMRWNDNSLPIQQFLDCLVIHHGITQETIGRWLDGKGLWQLKARYRVKQLIRSALPLDIYLALRRNLAGGWKSSN